MTRKKQLSCRAREDLCLFCYKFAEENKTSFNENQ